MATGLKSTTLQNSLLSEEEKLYSISTLSMSHFFSEIIKMLYNLQIINFYSLRKFLLQQSSQKSPSALLKHF